MCQYEPAKNITFHLVGIHSKHKWRIIAGSSDCGYMELCTIKPHKWNNGAFAPLEFKVTSGLAIERSFINDLAVFSNLSDIISELAKHEERIAELFYND